MPTWSETEGAGADPRGVAPPDGTEAANSRSPRLYYCPEYVYDVVERGFRHAFDVERPRRIHDALIEAHAAAPSDFIAPPPVSDAELRLVHVPHYLERIRRPDELAKLLLLDPSHPWRDDLLAPFLVATGGTIHAGLSAWFERRIGLNFGGGFHHAQADKGEGFCPIADVAIAVRVLQRRSEAARFLIVDLDVHHGNGNAEIFAREESVFTFSIHATNWCWIDKRNNLDVELPAGTADEAYLEVLTKRLPDVLERFEPDVVFYLAGADPFVEDDLGDFAMTEAGLLERDQFVTREITRRGVPMAVVTAGGYGEKSWKIYFNYYRWLLKGNLAFH